MKRSIALFLVISMLASLAACSPDTPETTVPESETTENANQETAEEPAPQYDFEGRAYRILCRTDRSYEFDITESSGDLVDDAVWERNLTVENEYGVSIQPITAAGTWSDRSTFTELITAAVVAGDDAYDLVAGYNAYITSLITQDCLTDLYTSDIDFSSPWWYAGFHDNVAIGGKMYFCLGDASLTMWENLEVVFFNRSLISDYNLDSPYDLVLNDTWYFDTMRQACAAVSCDVDQNNTYNEEDRWGMIFYNIRDLASYLGISYCTFDNDGYPVLSLYSERMIDTYAKLYDFLNPTHEAKQFTPDVDQKIFTENRALFFQAPLRYAELMRESDTDFGMVPFPKYDANQDRYYTTVVDDLSVFCIPASTQDLAYSGLILDALCRTSNELVIPKYYDTVLKYKYARDTESEGMLNIVRDSIWFDFGFIYSVALNGLGSFLDMVKNDDPDIASAWASKQSSYEAGLQTLIEYIKEN